MAHMFVNVFKRFLCDFKWICQNKGVTDNLNLSNEKKLPHMFQALLLVYNHRFFNTTEFI